MIDFKKYWHHFILHDTIIPDLKEWTKTHSLPGLGKVPLYNVLKLLQSNLTFTDVMLRASAISFNLLMAFFPFTIFLLTTLPYFPIDNALSLFESYIHGLIPLNVERALFGLITDTIQPRSGLLSLGFIAAAYFASNGMIALMNAFDQVQGLEKFNRNFFVQRGIALLLTLVLTLILATSVITIVLSRVILSIIDDYVTFDYFTKGFILSARWLPIVLLVYVFLAAIYRFAPSIKYKIPFFSIGAAIATILLIVVSAIISYFVNNFANYNKIYGSIGAVIALLIWLQTNMFVILFGYEVNLSVIGARTRNLL